jgi:hypothetical protein
MTQQRTPHNHYSMHGAGVLAFTTNPSLLSSTQCAHPSDERVSDCRVNVKGFEVSNPYKEGSRKAAIYDVFRKAGGGDAGLKAAFKYAARKDVGIKEGTVRSWSSMWLKGTTKPNKDKAPKPETKTRVVTPDDEQYPFKYTSRAAADRAHEAMCTRTGMRSHAFHVIESDGRFAVVPSHYKPGGPPPTFSKGDLVHDAFIANSAAKVIEAGPEQCIIRYVKERPKGPQEECVINRFLVAIPKAAPKAKSKREKL